jgi:hypothetical protein
MGYCYDKPTAGARTANIYTWINWLKERELFKYVIDELVATKGASLCEIDLVGCNSRD